jgi:hypothetical protein
MPPPSPPPAQVRAGMAGMAGLLTPRSTQLQQVHARERARERAQGLSPPSPTDTLLGSSQLGRRSRALGHELQFDSASRNESENPSGGESVARGGRRTRIRYSRANRSPPPPRKNKTKSKRSKKSKGRKTRSRRRR